MVHQDADISAELAVRILKVHLKEQKEQKHNFMVIKALEKAISELEKRI